MSRLLARTFLATLAMSFSLMPLSPWWSYTASLSMFVAAELVTRMKGSDLSFLGFAINMFIIAFGHRTEMPALNAVGVLEHLRGSREQQIAGQLGLFVVTVEITKRPDYPRHIYFLRKSHLVMFKLKY